jgi:hypothetical protein
VINFKTFSKSYKHKKRLKNTSENQAVFLGVHDPIIDRVVWEQIQDKRNRKTRKRPNDEGERNMFSGLLVCADCNTNLGYHFNQKNPDIRYFNCQNYVGNRGTCPTTHYIRVDFLEQVVLQEIRRLTKFSAKHESEFSEIVIGHTQQAAVSLRDRKQKELSAMIARDKEIDRLFNRMYEDNTNGKLDDERFARMSSQYTAEQRGLAEKINTLGAELDKHNARAMTADNFISLVRKYTRTKTLNGRMLNELIERIEVYHAKKVDGRHMQRVVIHYNCIGEIDIPNTLTPPDITMQTRKGVHITYTQNPAAM